jgi:hypothetical protein
MAIASATTGLPGNPTFERHPPEVRENCFQLFKGGKKLTEITEITKVPLPTLRRWSSRDKWKHRVTASIPAPGKRTEQAGSILDNSSTEAEALALTMGMGEKQEHYKGRMQEQALRVPLIVARMTDKELIAHADKIGKLDVTARKALNLEEQKPSIVVNVGLLSTALPARPASVVLNDVNIAGELAGGAPEVTDAEFTAIEDAAPEPVTEKVEAK